MPFPRSAFLFFPFLWIFCVLHRFPLQNILKSNESGTGLVTYLKLSMETNHIVLCCIVLVLSCVCSLLVVFCCLWSCFVLVVCCVVFHHCVCFVFCSVFVSCCTGSIEDTFGKLCHQKEINTCELFEDKYSITDSLNRKATWNNLWSSVFVSKFLGEFGSPVCCSNCKLCWISV